jgi:hypothetical protein
MSELVLVKKSASCKSESSVEQGQPVEIHTGGDFGGFFDRMEFSSDWSSFKLTRLRLLPPVPWEGSHGVDDPSEAEPEDAGSLPHSHRRK